MLGVCYYPEHWPEAWWAEDACKMADLGLTYVRIGEFAWSRFEPDPGVWDFGWFDRAIDTLGDAGLKIVACTPTATPPKWLIDRYPEILPVDPSTGRTRGFGSRRHYDFASNIYRAESVRITTALAKRYGQHPHIAGWQTDNELACHETTLSGSVVARDAFRLWCRDRYGDVAALNAAWGNVFWSMEYRSFDEIELPVGAVTETSPSHCMAWRRFASDQVIRFHDDQVRILRAHSPGRFITHNFIPMDETGVDNHALASGLDFAAYDNYPLGRTDLSLAKASAEDFRPWMRTGHPDMGALYFDQTRGLTGKTFWVMEQQPGPVNWGAHNPRPAPGMVRLWSWEAFAHGASVVSYFRWRQAPFAQEQMHAGLLRPDRSEAEAWSEVTQVAAELKILDLEAHPATRSPVAILADHESHWVGQIERQGDSYDYTTLIAQWYGAIRGLGVDVDFIGPDGDPSGYKIVLIPALTMPDPAMLARLVASDAVVVFGPRSGAKTDEFTFPEGLPPGRLRELIPMRVLSVETLRPDCCGTISMGATTFESGCWRETIETTADVLATYEDDSPALIRSGQVMYLATLTEDAFLTTLFSQLCAQSDVTTTRLPPHIRLRRRGRLTFVFNYGNTNYSVALPTHARLIIGDPVVGPRDLVVWEDIT